MEEFVLYILYSPGTGKSYVGFTSHLIERIRSHNIYGSDWTKKCRPWIVVYVEFYSDKAQVVRREKYFKSGRGLYHKKQIIQDFLSFR
jgi:putative endonuclease